MLRPRDSSSLFFFWLASSAPFLDRTRRGNAQTHAAGEALVFPRPVNVFLRPGGEWRGVHGGGKHPSLNLSSPLFLLLLLLLLLSLFFFRGRGSCDQNAIYRPCLRFSSSPVLRERFFSSFEKEPRSPSLLSLSLSRPSPNHFTSTPPIPPPSKPKTLQVLACSKRFVHDWTSCPFAHAGEKARRRDPRDPRVRYTGIACPDMKSGGGCARGELCPYAHNVFEYWLHPTR